MIISFAGQKGGSGKTTLAIAVAAELFARRHSVLLVDADPQGSARTWGEVAAESEHAAPTIVSMGADMHKPGQLPKLAAAFKHVVIDCPPRKGDVQRAALMVSDCAVLPCGPAAVDAWALAESIELVHEAQTLRPQLKGAVFVTRKTNTVVGKSAREVLADCGLPLLKAEIGYRVAYQEALAAGLGVTKYAAGSQAAKEAKALTNELLALGRKRGKHGA